MRVKDLIKELERLPNLDVYLEDDELGQWSPRFVQVDQMQNVVIVK